MATVAYEQALEVVRALAPEEQQRLLQQIESEHGKQLQLANGGATIVQPRALEMRWLAEHEAEYAGQWLALDGDQLVSCGTDPHKVYAEAQAQGVQDPFMVIAESDEPYFGGW
jgi:hypothetical protein